ncbi:uncharacterized protein LOC127007035 isoform X3 [Eriocheir sinensis]|uniref:uncharacterized protein LOC127007035 isoform X3 n=1 Tax=Eriocheir sinensis TaxID=95602 RepID=UPI0021C58567|nr:uncharacterized protein LOC127007035 isoform X3 [Eriocheir sinensis]
MMMEGEEEKAHHHHHQHQHPRFDSQQQQQQQRQQEGQASRFQELPKEEEEDEDEERRKEKVEEKEVEEEEEKNDHEGIQATHSRKMKETERHREGGGGRGGCKSSVVEITDSLSSWVSCQEEETETRRRNDEDTNTRREEETRREEGGGGRGGNNNLAMETQTGGGTCGEDWVEEDGRCFRLVEEVATWEEAERACGGGRGGGGGASGHLAAVTSPAVAHLLQRLISDSGRHTPETAYWIGATDAQHENSFTWTSGAPFFYTEWFPGWSDQGGYGAQPSDDGLGLGEDCVELRAAYRRASKGSRTTERLFWNDRNCAAKNPFLCERRAPGAPTGEERWACSQDLMVSLHGPPTIVTSPAFPARYPPSQSCVTTLTAPPSSHLLVEFDAFDLEPHKTCDYDWLTVEEKQKDEEAKGKEGGKQSEETGRGRGGGGSVRRCGDWSGRLKLLRFESRGNRVVLTFSSDYAHGYSGFRARVTALPGGGCGDGREMRLGDYCYLVVPFNRVSWATATHICRDMEGQLARVSGREVAGWLGERIRALPDYRGGRHYWVGGSLRPHAHTWTWSDGTALNITEMGGVEVTRASGDNQPLCLSLQERGPSPLTSPPPLQRHTAPLSLPPLSLPPLQQSSPQSPSPSRPLPPRPAMALTAHHCELTGGFVCSRKVPDPPSRQSRIVVGQCGNLTSPNYPSPYPNNLHLTTTLRGPPLHRLVLSFSKIDLEYQDHCLYDYLGLQSSEGDPMLRYCGRHTTEMDRFDWVSRGNEALVTFHADWSVGGAGVRGAWRVVDTSHCPHHNLTKPQGVFASPNFPHFYLEDLHCTTTITAPEGHRVWLQFTVFEVGGAGVGADEQVEGKVWDPPLATPSTSSTAPAGGDGKACELDYVEVVLGSGPGEFVRLCGRVEEGEVGRLSYVSYGASLTLILHTTHRGGGRGFQATYSTGTSFTQQAVLKLGGRDGRLHGLNFPLPPPPAATLARRLVAPIGHQIDLHLHHVAVLATPDAPCTADYVEVEDFYAEGRGALWRVCKVAPGEPSQLTIRSTYNTLLVREVHQPPPPKPKPNGQPLTTAPTHPNPSVPESNSSSSSSFSSSSSSSRVLQKEPSVVYQKALHRRRSAPSPPPPPPPSSPLPPTVPHLPLPYASSATHTNSSSSSSSSVPNPNPPSPLTTTTSTSTKAPTHRLHPHPPPHYAPAHHAAPPNSHNAVLYNFGLHSHSSPPPSTLSSHPQVVISSSSSSSSPSPSLQPLSPPSSYSVPYSPSSSSSIAAFSISYSIVPDPEWLNRSRGAGVVGGVLGGVGVGAGDGAGVAWCDPSPCLNHGVCVDEGNNHTCVCSGGYTGAFCQITWCDVSPCLYGRCQPGGDGNGGFLCVCEPGYSGQRCQIRVSPCDGDPCQSRGTCTAANHTFHCQCHAWWEGERCQNRMLRIPYKPLSERIFEEPFWLGLMTVAVVMGCIGVIFCIKKHFAEKIEKFFAEEIERSKYGTMSPAPSRLAPLPSPTGLSPRPRPKSLFVRLNSFRKASLLSLSSTASSPQCDAPAFTFDDLLRLHKRTGSASAGPSSSPRRTSHKSRSQTASPRGESKKILRHLVTPPVGHRAASFDEFLHLRSQNPKCSVERTRSADIATELLRTEGAEEVAVAAALVRETSLTSFVASPSKHDKKVTFAKLLDKMSKEISSSSSDTSCTEEKSPSRIFSLGGVRRSPRRSPRIRHTQRYSGSGSEDVMETPEVSSSEMTPDPPKRLLSVKSSSSPSSKTSSPQSRTKMVKISSADSLLAMFKSLGGSGRGSISNPPSPHGSELEDSSAHASPSTTPTTPQKALPQVKQDTLTVPGTLQVQVQGAGGAAQHPGPVITLEVPAGDQHRCLSPITELPTPVPTPVPSPLPTPSRYRPKMRTSSESNDNKDSEDTESEFSLSISVERSSSDSSGPDHRIFFTPPRGMRSTGSLGAVGPAPRRPGTLSPTITPSSSLSSRTPSPITSPVTSPATSPKIKTKPPPLHIPGANVLLFSGEKSGAAVGSRGAGCGRGAGGGRCAGGGEGFEIGLVVPVIKVEDIDEGKWQPPPPPRPRAFSVDGGAIMSMPLITVSPAEEPPAAPAATLSPPATQPMVIPTLNVTFASPPALRKPIVPTISVEEPESAPHPPSRRHHHHLQQQRGKGGSLDLPPAPAITVTATNSEVESDTDSPTGMCRPGGPPSCYLSPFLGVDLRASESNLSSSGYSSAYSPGPSRCSSSNPLFPDEPITPSHSALGPRPLTLPPAPPDVCPPPRTKRRPLLKSPPAEASSVDVVTCPLLRTDSETTDDPAASQPEADSALELDTNDECSDSVVGGGGGVDTETCLDDEAEAQRHRLLLSSSHSFPKESPRLARSPPAIVVHSSLQSESSLEDQVLGERPARLSPVSSRSESPISDSRLSVVRIYPAFFGVNTKSELPYTDSDGLYDCPSSEVLHSDSHASGSPLKRLGRKRLKRSAGKGLRSLLGLGSSEGGAGGGGGGGAGTGTGAGGVAGQKTRLEPPSWERSPRRHSPKRRVRAQTSVDLLSSSNESITSTSLAGSSSGPGETTKQQEQQQKQQKQQQQQQQQRRESWWSSGGGGGGSNRRRRPLLRTESIPLKYLPRQGSVDASGEETQEEQLMLKPGRSSDEVPRHRKISRFRSFGNQIRKKHNKRLRQTRGGGGSGEGGGGGEERGGGGGGGVEGWRADLLLLSLEGSCGASSCPTPTRTTWCPRPEALTPTQNVGLLRAPRCVPPAARRPTSSTWP